MVDVVLYRCNRSFGLKILFRLLLEPRLSLIHNIFSSCSSCPGLSSLPSYLWSYIHPLHIICVFSPTLPPLISRLLCPGNTSLSSQKTLLLFLKCFTVFCCCKLIQLLAFILCPPLTLSAFVCYFLVPLCLVPLPRVRPMTRYVYPSNGFTPSPGINPSPAAPLTTYRDLHNFISPPSSGSCSSHDLPYWFLLIS